MVDQLDGGELKCHGGHGGHVRGGDSFRPYHVVVSSLILA